jgi:hypothetical protein
MANEEHQAMLSQGVEIWNQWRTANLKACYLFKANLEGASLQGASLQRSDLQKADLTWTKLQAANLRRANLQKANLEGANLEGADLGWTNLRGANFRRSVLEMANLREADLREANFGRTKLLGCQFDKADIGRAIFADVDFRGVQGLGAVRHAGPSTIGIDTLYRSSGDIPESFLRGCGVPDSMIEYAHALVAAERPIDYYSCFISYSSEDEALAERLYADLQMRGVRCWLAPHDLTPGDVIVRGIDEAIRLHDKVVLLLSEAAVMSRWVRYEVDLACTREAREGRIVLYPLRLDDSVLTSRQDWAVTLCEGRHIGDFRRWTEYVVYQTVFVRLLHDLKAEKGV